jgi:hypothetical protein
MKVRCSSLRILFLLLFVFFLSTAPIYAQNSEKAYIYPIQPGTPEWAALETHDDMIAASQIPADLLEKLSTESLLDAVLRYPLYGDMLAYNRAQDGFNRVTETFNGMQALLQRKDLAVVTMKRYGNMDPSAINRSWSDLQKGEYAREVTYLEILLAQPALLEQLTPDQQTQLLRDLAAKVEAKLAVPEVYGPAGLESTLWVVGRLHQMSSGVSTNTDTTGNGFVDTGRAFNWADFTPVLAQMSPVLEARGQSLLAELNNVPAAMDINAVVHTPRGTQVNVIQTGWELSAPEIRANDDWVRRTYPNATLLRSSTRRYNCHSYAWHSQNANNIFWMNQPNQSNYWTDGSYFELNYCPINSAKVRYTDDDHSANIDGAGVLTSKWGALGMVRHVADYAPYKSSNLKFYRLR